MTFASYNFFMKKFFALLLAVINISLAFSQTYTRELKLYSKRMNGDDVMMLQLALLNLGFTEVGEADGWFGPKTEASNQST